MKGGDTLMGEAERGVMMLVSVAKAAGRGAMRGGWGLLAASMAACVGLLWLPAVGDVDGDVLPALALFGLVVNTVLLAGLALTGLLAARGGELSGRTFLQAFWPPGRWLVNIGLGAIVGAAVGLGLLALVVPGLVLLVRLGFAVLFVNEGSYGVFAALRESWALTAGKTGRLLAALACSVVALVVGLGFFVVGVVPVLAVGAVAWGALFDLLRQERAAAQSGEG